MLFEKLAEDGKITRYRARAKYFEKSVIPILIEITARDPGEFVVTLAIWGEPIQDDGSGSPS